MHQFADFGFEAGEQAIEPGGAFGLGRRFGQLLGGKAIGHDGVFAQDFDGGGDGADFVCALPRGDGGGSVASGEAADGGGDASQRVGNAAPEHEGD